jgi:hypothetical protein
MDIDLIAKLVALFVGILGLPKLWHEISERRRTRLRDQLSNSKELANSVTSQTNALVVQSAYAALTGRKPLHPYDIQRLMLLEQPLRAFSAFHTGQEFLQRSNGRLVPFCFKQAYRSRKRRERLLVRFSALYFAFAVLAAGPLLFAGQIFSVISGFTLLGLLAWGVFFGWLAKIALDRFEGLIAAGRLLKIRLARSNNSFKPAPRRA